MMAAQQWIFWFDDAGHPIAVGDSRVSQACADLNYVPNCAKDQVKLGWHGCGCDETVCRDYYCCISATRPEGLLTAAEAVTNPCPPTPPPLDSGVLAAGGAVAASLLFIGLMGWLAKRGGILTPLPTHTDRENFGRGVIRTWPGRDDV